MGIQSLAGASRDTLPASHIPPDSRRVAFRGPSSEGFCRMPRLLNRDFVSVSIPQQPIKRHRSLAPRLSK
jgi:hypothetical protein